MLRLQAHLIDHGLQLIFIQSPPIAWNCDQRRFHHVVAADSKYIDLPIALNEELCCASHITIGTAMLNADRFTQSFNVDTFIAFG
jgi:hypothetical protein